MINHHRPYHHHTLIIISIGRHTRQRLFVRGYAFMRTHANSGDHSFVHVHQCMKNAQPMASEINATSIYHMSFCVITACVDNISAGFAVSFRFVSFFFLRPIYCSRTTLELFPNILRNY